MKEFSSSHTTINGSGGAEGTGSWPYRGSGRLPTVAGVHARLVPGDVVPEGGAGQDGRGGTRVGARL